MLWLLSTQSSTFRKRGKKKKVRQEAKSPGAGKQKTLFIQSTHQIKQTQNKLQQDWVIHISNKLKEKNPVIFHSISHQRAITTDYSLNAMMTLPLPPRGFSDSPAQPWKLSHLPPFYISLHIQFVPFQMLWVLTSAVSLFFLSFDFYQLQEKKTTQTHVSDQMCMTHNATPECTAEFTQIQLSQKIRSLSKIKPIQEPKSREEGRPGSCFQFLHR